MEKKNKSPKWGISFALGKMTTRIRIGRPRLPKAQRRSRKVFFRVTPAEYKDLVAAARRAGMPVSEFVSKIVNETTRKDG